MATHAEKSGETQTADTTTVLPARAAPARKPQRQPPYAVILHNDDINTFEFVVLTLRKVFAYDEQKAYELTMRAHRTGRSCVWTGMKEHAELRADQIKSCGPDPIMKHRGAMALGVTIEPMPET